MKMDDVQKILENLASELKKEYELHFGWPDNFMNLENLIQLLVSTRDIKYSGRIEEDGLPLERSMTAWCGIGYHKGKFIIITSHTKRRMEIENTDSLKKILDDYYLQHKDDWRQYKNPEELV